MKHVNASEIIHSGVVTPIKQLLRALFASILFFLFVPFAWSATYYVATTGNDASSGSLSAPFKTIQKAMNTAIAGDTVYVRGGVYREDVEATRNGGAAGKMLNVQAYNNELPVIKGSDVVTGWVKYSGNIWKKTGWAYNSQQVFVGGGDIPSLQQIGIPSSFYTTFEYPSAVGSGLSSMKAGSFYYDKAASSLYVWLADGADPNTKYMEASTRRRLFFMGKPYIHLKGFAFRHSNVSAYAQMGSAIELSSNSIIESCDVQYTDFAGIGLGYLQTGAKIINCNASNNGDSGINGPGSYNFLVSNCIMNHNNTRNFNPLWHAGGFKATTKTYGIVENSEVGNNNGSGIWFDYANGGNQIIIRNNYIYNNGPKEGGIFLEVSKNVMVYNNVIANNKRRGIYVSASDNTRVYNNTVYGTGDYAGIEVNGMPRSGASLTGNTVINNIVAYGTSKYDIYIAAANGSSILNNTSDYNDIYRPSGAIQLFMGSLFSTIASFSSSSKQDVHSINVNPGFVGATKPTSGSSFAVGASSPVIDKGTTVAGVGYDYLNVLRPKGGAFDLGAFEYTGASTASTPTPSPSGADTTPPVISFVNPLQNATVRRGSSLSISIKATDNVGVTGMSMYVDGGSNVRSSSGQVAYSWNSTNARIGTHTITVSANDAKGNFGKQSITFKVQ